MMNMNKVEMSDEMLEQVNGGSDVFTYTFEKMKEVYTSDKYEKARDTMKNTVTDLWDKTTDTLSDAWDETTSTVESTLVVIGNWLGL